MEISSQTYANMMKSAGNKEQIASAINSIVDEKEHIEEMRFRLTGYKFKRVNEKVIREQINDGLVNESGAQQIISYYSGFLAKNIILSCFDEKMINIICKQFDRGLLDELTVNILNYGIYDGENLRKIWRLLSVNHQAVLNRSLKALTLINALENISVSEVRELNPQQVQQKQGGLLGNFRIIK